jgi:hypothetical protein
MGLMKVTVEICDLVKAGKPYEDQFLVETRINADIHFS